MNIDFFIWTKYQKIKPKDVVHDLSKESLKNWLEDFIEIIEKKPLRDYKFNSETGESCVSINKIINSKNHNDVHILAERLGRQEEITSERVKMTEILQGALVQFILKEGDDIQYYLAKIDYSGVINEEVKTIKGLPTLKKDLSFKLCKIIASINDSQVSIDRILLGDSNGPVSEFWWNGFLETSPVNNDAVNSKTAFSEIEKYLKKNIYKKSPPDYNEMRNQFVAYMRREESFSINSLADSICKNYIPESDDIDINKVKAELLELPNKYDGHRKFDKQFNIVQEEIKGRVKKKYNLSSSIVLELKHDIDDLSHTIVSKKNGQEKGIWIKTEVGYNEFPGDGNVPDENQ